MPPTRTQEEPHGSSNRKFISLSKSSNHQTIFRASFLTGGAQIVGLIIGLIKNKAVAVILGTTGIGYTAILNQAFGVMQAISTLGIPSAGARSVALDRDDEEAIGLSVCAVRQACTALACLVALVTACASPLISNALFGDYQHTPDILVLVASLLFAQMASAEQTILRGLGHIRVLAKINVIAAVSGGAITIPCIYFLGLRGVAPSILAASIALYWFSRRDSSKLNILRNYHCRESISQKAWSLARVGSTFFGLSLIGMTLGLGLSILVLRHEGIAGNGVYQAAAGLTVTIASFVLSAMGQDFYPKIVNLFGKGQKEDVAVYCANQVEMGLLMALPILASVSFFSHELIKLVYTSEFHAADPLVGVMAASCWARICYWPHMLCMLAEANAVKVLIAELGFALSVALISWVTLPFFGVAGVACTYAACFFIYAVCVSWIVAGMTGHMPLREIWRLYVTGLILILVGFYCNPVAKGILLMLLTAYVLRRLLIRLGPQHRLTRIIRGVPLIRCLAPINP